MRSVIHESDAVRNTARKFGAANCYYPARLRGFGTPHALFTRAQIEAAIERAKSNPEDLPSPTWLERVLAFLRGEL